MEENRTNNEKNQLMKTDIYVRINRQGHQDSYGIVRVVNYIHVLKKFNRDLYDTNPRVNF